MAIKKYVFGPFASDVPYVGLQGTKYEKSVPNATGAGVVFADGKNILGELFIDKLSKDIVTRLAVHGISQKGGDSYANAGSEADPVKAATAWLTETLGQLTAGQWRTSATGGTQASLLEKAIARAMGVDLEQAQIFVEGLSDDEKKAVRADAAVKAATAQIKLEQQAAQKAKLEAAAKAKPEGSSLAGMFKATMTPKAQ